MELLAEVNESAIRNQALAHGYDVQFKSVYRACNLAGALDLIKAEEEKYEKMMKEKEKREKEEKEEEEEEKKEGSKPKCKPLTLVPSLFTKKLEATINS